MGNYLKVSKLSTTGFILSFSTNHPNYFQWAEEPVEDNRELLHEKSCRFTLENKDFGSLTYLYFFTNLSNLYLLKLPFEHAYRL